MGRRLRASVPQQSKPARAPVTAYTHVDPKGWSLPQAVSLVQQGYSVQHVSKVTGFDQKVIRAAALREGDRQ